MAPANNKERLDHTIDFLASFSFSHKIKEGPSKAANMKTKMLS